MTSQSNSENLLWSDYKAGAQFDELVMPDGTGRPASSALLDYLGELGIGRLRTRQVAANRAIVELGISFTVYSDGENIDRAWPFDVIPRTIDAAEWDKTTAGLTQRLKALNCFIADVYGDRNIVKAGKFPADLIETSGNYLRACQGVRPIHDVWANICGSDLVRSADGTLYVLEDNLRVPSGVSYMLENRAVAKQVFPEIFARQSIRPVDDYPSELFDMLATLSPRPGDDPEVVVLTPGIYNSAYFEHAYLAQRMGAELVEGRDLIVRDDDCVYMLSVEGLTRVDVVYSRVNAEYLDPNELQADSMLGVPGLIRAWRAGNVSIANAPGTGVADDKVVYAYVPDMIRFYLDEEPLLENVPTYLCSEPKSLDYVLNNLHNLVVKPANESGGYGMLVGPHATKEEHAKFRDLLKARPRNYIGQPVIELSTAPTLVDEGVQGRHLDLRPFVLQGQGSYVTPGGLTRVALRKGSLVVNSSQGGGSKDTWVVESQD